MGLLRLYLRAETAELHKNNVRIKIIGDRRKLPDDIVKLIEHSEGTTENNTGLTAILALSYGGRQDITHAVQSLAREVAAGRLAAEDIDEKSIDRALATAGIPGSRPADTDQRGAAH